MSINHLAEKYVKLVLALGKHHSSYVDAYYGPSEWLSDSILAISDIQIDVINLLDHLSEVSVPKGQELRVAFLEKQVKSMLTFIHVIEGKAPSFDEESLALYDAVSPHLTDHDFELILNELSSLIPGEDDLTARVIAFNQQFEIPKNRLNDVFEAAINRSREVTKQFISLDENEQFKLEYVTDKVWSGYNWFKGNNFSLIQMNTDFPIYISRAVDLAAHEGYPGHHVFNSLMERHLVKKKGWVEYSIYPLFSPMSLLAEGTANYGIEVVFPRKERIEFEKTILFPLAGLNPECAEQYYKIQNVMQKLSYADNMIAKQLLDGQICNEQAIKKLVKYTLVPLEKAKQRLGFIKANRAYVVNYNLGQDLVKAYIEKHADMNNKTDIWRVFTELLSTPKSASMLLT